ncbi:hypothetical protein M3N64_13520 [Sporolactobacillus sp. CPB3-1]|uniref:DUF3139 domain-containing protein n=1 Tax=Sporolactobacillus mangiferae TaxID=2940498 RepID=A0ABT0MDJ8_9BACL|nr:hypothetical protein [Sporolactobacillus mangiferae]MCL1632940.1 hypothetical protein [Sporolactobacillus mangiferae]
MSKYSKVSVIAFVVVVFVLGTLLAFHQYQLNRQHNRETALKAINRYILKQGIDQKDIVVSDFFYGDDNQYHRFIYVKGEKENIAYEYIYKSEAKKIMFIPEEVAHKYILKKEWGGSQLSESETNKIKYPPPGKKYTY